MYCRRQLFLYPSTTKQHETRSSTGTIQALLRACWQGFRTITMCRWRSAPAEPPASHRRELTQRCHFNVLDRKPIDTTQRTSSSKTHDDRSSIPRQQNLIRVITRDTNFETKDRQASPTLPARPTCIARQIPIEHPCNQHTSIQIQSHMSLVISRNTCASTTTPYASQCNS